MFGFAAGAAPAESLGAAIRTVDAPKAEQKLLRDNLFDINVPLGLKPLSMRIKNPVIF
jgi:hypothetical protein